MTINFILIVGVLVFAASSLYFAFNKQKSDTINSALIVSFITLVSYLIFIEGSLVAATSTGDPLFWTRWVGYIASCSLLMWHIASRIKLATHDKIELMFFTSICMATGAFASVFTGWMMIWMFLAGGATFIMMLYKLWQGDKAELAPIKKYIYFGWCVFPLVFILSPEGFGLISTALSLIVILALDVFTKIIFYVEESRS